MQLISKFKADFGGTNIATPLHGSIEMPDNGVKKIFILTDGAVNNPQEVVDTAKNDICCVHTVGIGKGCDEKLLKDTAEAGKGSCSLISDDDHEGVLNSKVIMALEYASEPALEHCTLEFGGS